MSFSEESFWAQDFHANEYWAAVVDADFVKANPELAAARERLKQARIEVESACHECSLAAHYWEGAQRYEEAKAEKAAEEDKLKLVREEFISTYFKLGGGSSEMSHSLEDYPAATEFAEWCAAEDRCSAAYAAKEEFLTSLGAKPPDHHLENVDDYDRLENVKMSAHDKFEMEALEAKIWAAGDVVCAAREKWEQVYNALQ